MKALRVPVILLLVQIALVGLYLGVEWLRREEPRLVYERLEEPAPPLLVLQGEARAALPSSPHLVHFWATWCGPCQEELPALIEATESIGVPLVAVTDEPWPMVERYFEGAVPWSIVRDPTGQAAAVWRVSGLPDTFVVRDGRVVGRMGEIPGLEHR